MSDQTAPLSRKLNVAAGREGPSSTPVSNGWEPSLVLWMPHQRLPVASFLVSHFLSQLASQIESHNQGLVALGGRRKIHRWRDSLLRVLWRDCPEKEAQNLQQVLLDLFYYPILGKCCQFLEQKPLSQALLRERHWGVVVLLLSSLSTFLELLSAIAAVFGPVRFINSLI